MDAGSTTDAGSPDAGQSGATGVLDTTFDTDGTSFVEFGWNDRARGVAIQPDGKIIAAGWADGSRPEFAVARFNSDGTLDTTFDSDGTRFFTFGTSGFGGHEQAYDVALQADGKIVVVGFTDAGTGVDDGSQTVAAIARLNSDGSLDGTFAGDGLQTVDIPDGDLDQLNAVAIQGDGKVVAAGFVDGGLPDWALIRFNTDGSLDTTFDADGIQAFTFGSGSFGGHERAQGVAVQSDGKIVAVGFTDAGTGVNDGTQSFAAIARLNSDGSLDGTFAGDGLQTVDIPNGGLDQLNAVAIQGDGKIVAAGFVDGGRPDFALVRLDTDGSLDTTFDADGIQAFTFGSTTFGGEERAEDLVLQADGKIVVAGYANLSDTGEPFDVALARLSNDGSLDFSFGTDGLVTTDLGGNDLAFGAALQPDGRIVVVGYSDQGPDADDNDFLVQRYE
jgi:uncharacterized delta-60 repeat protein